MNNTIQNVELATAVMRFEQDHLARAEEMLRHKYAIPETDSMKCAFIIFEKISTYNFSVSKIGDIVLWNTFHKFAAQETKALKQQMSKNFGLTEKGFTEMCNSLRHGNEDIFEQVFMSHFNDCITYLKSNYTISHEDAYDATMDTLIAFRKKLIDGKISYGNVRYLFTKMASQIFIKSQNRLKRVDGLTYDSDSTVDEEELQVLEKAIGDLGSECQELLKLNFYEKLTIVEIAKIKDKNAASMRKTKQRCLFKLKSLFTKYNY